jgi:hypothetical protein
MNRLWNLDCSISPLLREEVLDDADDDFEFELVVLDLDGVLELVLVVPAIRYKF